MKIGANYTPSQGWFHSWLDLDIDATPVSYTHLTLPTTPYV